MRRFVKCAALNYPFPIEDSFPRRAHRVCTPSFSIITFHNHVFSVTFFYSIPEYPPLTRPGEPILPYQLTQSTTGKCVQGIFRIYISRIYIFLFRSSFLTRRKRRASVVYIHTSEWFAATLPDAPLPAFPFLLDSFTRVHFTPGRAATVLSASSIFNIEQNGEGVLSATCYY